MSTFSHLPPLLKPLFPFRIQRVGASHIERESVEGQTTQVERNSRSSHEDVCKYYSEDWGKECIVNSPSRLDHSTSSVVVAGARGADAAHSVAQGIERIRTPAHAAADPLRFYFSSHVFVIHVVRSCNHVDCFSEQVMNAQRVQLDAIPLPDAPSNQASACNTPPH